MLNVSPNLRPFRFKSSTMVTLVFMSTVIGSFEFQYQLFFLFSICFLFIYLLENGYKYKLLDVLCLGLAFISLTSALVRGQFYPFTFLSIATAGVLFNVLLYHSKDYSFEFLKRFIVAVSFFVLLFISFSFIFVFSFEADSIYKIFDWLGLVFKIGGSSSGYTSSDLVIPLLITNCLVMPQASVFKRFWLALLTLFVVIICNKIILLLAIILLYLLFVLNYRFTKVCFLAVVLIVNLYPYFMIELYYLGIFNEPEIDLLLNFRGRIWAEAVGLLDAGGRLSIKDFIFGVSNPEIRVLVPFSAVKEYMTVSFHSGLLRLLVMEGYLVFFIGLNGLLLFLYKTCMKVGLKKGRYALSYICAYVLLLVSDGSIFAGSVWITGLLLPVIILLHTEFREFNRTIRHI